jgi:hypothetical protein
MPLRSRHVVEARRIFAAVATRPSASRACCCATAKRIVTTDGKDEHVCSPGPIKAGNVFSGTATWTSCRLRKDHPVSLQIVAVKKAKFFGARLGVRARITADYVEDDHDAVSYEVKGYYVYGKKVLVLVPLESGSRRMGAVCRWNHGDDERAECHLVQQGSLHECADFFISHHDD